MAEKQPLFDVLHDPRARALSPAGKLALVYLRRRQGSNGEQPGRAWTPSRRTWAWMNAIAGGS